MSEARLKIIPVLEQWVYCWILVTLASLCFSMALTEVSFVAAFVGWIILKKKKWNRLPVERTASFVLLGFVLLSVVSFFWSEFPKQSFRGAIKILKYFLLFWMVVDTLSTSDRQQKAFQTLAFIFIFLGFDGIWQYVFGADLLRGILFEPASSGPRISASLHNYGLLASFVISFLPLLASRLKKNGDKGFMFRLSLGIVLGLLLLFWTRLRGAWIAFLGGLAFFVWMRKNRILLLLTILTVATIMFVLPQSMIIHLDAEGKEQSLIERFYLWDRALQVIEARPWTGTGINTYAVAHQKYDRRNNWRVRNYYAHNGYLQIAAETGLPSLFCFLAFLFLYFKKAFGLLKILPEGIEKRTVVGFLSGVVNFLILALIDTTLHNPQAVMGFWFLLGWGIAYQNSIVATPTVSSQIS